jgi:uncharacterized membrane protein HdeD (DUF308 family)
MSNERPEIGFHWRSLLFLGAFLTILGLLAILYPVSSSVAVGWLVGFLLVAELCPLRGWGALAFSSAISFLLGVVLLINFPISALWAPGLVVGIDLVSHGFAYFLIANGIRKGLEAAATSEIRKAA